MRVQVFENSVLIDEYDDGVDPPDVSPVQDIVDALVTNPDVFPADTIAALRAALA